MPKRISYPGHVEKAKSQIMSHLKAVDVVMELIDARIPYSGRAYEWKRLFHNKPTVIVLTKKDLADPKVTGDWVRYYRDTGKEAFPISLKGSTKKVISDLKRIRDAIPLRQSVRKAMIVGIPNVGKSSLVNAIKKHGKASVGNEPGITKGVQWMLIDDDLMVLDTPGILYKDLHAPHVLKKLVLSGCVRAEEGLIEESIEYGILYLQEHYPHLVQPIASILEGASDNKRSFLDQYALDRGFLSKKGNPDRQRALVYWSKQFSDGLLGIFSLETPKMLFEKE